MAGYPGTGAFISHEQLNFQTNCKMPRSIIEIVDWNGTVADWPFIIIKVRWSEGQEESWEPVPGLPLYVINLCADFFGRIARNSRIGGPGEGG